jgi:hypothetical protein
MATQHTWPFDRGHCSVTNDEIVCWRRRSVWRRPRSSGPVQVDQYWLFPFYVQTIFWIEDPKRRGFVMFRPNRLMGSLRAHGWSLDVRTVSWGSWLPKTRPE